MSQQAPGLYGVTHAVPPMTGPIAYPKASPGPRASYDAAQDTHSNRSHWANADGLSAKAANSPEVRRKLRNRARLEYDNGGNCKGSIETYAHDLVGTGPRNQLTLPAGSHKDAAGTLERLFRDWCDDPIVNFAEKLRIMVEAEVRDGESFAVFIKNELVKGKLKLDFQVLDAEQVATPTLNPLDKKAVDGIEFDDQGNPVAYHILKEHPGDLAYNPGSGYTRQLADNVIHWFRPSRASQCRGIPRITPGLPLLPMIRGYSTATLTAARRAAQISAVIETNGAPDTGPVPVKPYDPVEWENDMALTMPAGWKMNQIEPEQPTSNHKEFKETNLAEFGRAIHQSRGVVTGDHSGYNFSSARMDRLIGQSAMRIERNRLAVRVTDRIFAMWARWAMATRGYIPDHILITLKPVETWTWAWQYDAAPAINPVDDANADKTNLEKGLVNHGQLLNERGVDWREHFKATAEQYAYAKELGIDHLFYGEAGADSGSVSVTDENGSRTTIAMPKAAAQKAAAAPAAAAAAAGADVQATALNGAQVLSMISVCDKLVAKQYTAGATEAILQAAFPGIDRKLIATIVKELKDHEPPAPPAAPATQPRPAEAPKALADDEDTALEFKEPAYA